MEEIRLVLSARQRRRLIRPVAMASVICLPCLLLKWQVGLVFAGIFLPAVLWAVDGMFGTTRLTATGIHLRSPLRRSFIPWSEAGPVEAQERTARAGSYRVAVVRVAGRRRPRVLPGLRGEAFQRDWEFDTALRKVSRYRRQAARSKTSPDAGQGCSPRQHGVRWGAYHRRVDEIRIALSARQRLNTMIPTVIVTAILCAGAAFAPWQLAVGIAAVLLPIVLWAVNFMYGSTRLTPQGIKLRGLYRHRFIPWSETGMVEAQERKAKASTYQVAVVHVAGRRRPCVLLGLRADAYQDEREFRAGLERIRSYQRQAVRSRSKGSGGF